MMSNELSYQRRQWWRCFWRSIVVVDVDHSSYSLSSPVIHLFSFLLSFSHSLLFISSSFSFVVIRTILSSWLFSYCYSLWLSSFFLCPSHFSLILFVLIRSLFSFSVLFAFSFLLVPSIVPIRIIVIIVIVIVAVRSLNDQLLRRDRCCCQYR